MNYPKQKVLLYMSYLFLFYSLSACEDIPKRDYEHFRYRTASLRPDFGNGSQEQSSVLADLRGCGF